MSALATLVLAQAAPPGQSAEDQSSNFLVSPNIGLMIWTLLAFLVALFILRKYAWPAITNALDKRQRAIEESIDVAERTRAEAQELLQEYRERLREARAQADEIVARARKAGEVHERETFFFSPYFSTEEKKQGLDKALEGEDDVVRNFLAVLIENHRMPALFRIRRELDAMWREVNKLLPVQVTSAVELDEAVTRQIGEEIGRQTGRKGELTTNVDPDVLGGIVLRVGNSILDASIRTRLDRLRKQVARA